MTAAFGVPVQVSEYLPPGVDAVLIDHHSGPSSAVIVVGDEAKFRWWLFLHEQRAIARLFLRATVSEVERRLFG